MISLLRERNDDLSVHVVLNRDDDGICESFANRLDCLCGGCVKLFPSIEDEAGVHFVSVYDGFASPWARFDNRDHLAFGWCQ